MSTVGQAAGYVVGGVIGSFFGATIIGAQIGGMVGGYIDPPKGPNVEGPRLSDTKQQTATYGAFIPRAYGNVDISGNVFYIENNALKEVAKKESQGGKGGGGGAQTTTYAYYGTFAVGLCECPPGDAKRLGRIWIGGKLFYDPTGSGLETSIASGEVNQYFSFYSGAATQQPDPRMQAVLGVGSTPAYRGLCYIVFKDLPLADYGNSIVGTQVKVEILSSSATAANSEQVTTLPNHAGSSHTIPTLRIENNVIHATTISLGASSDLIDVVGEEHIIGTGARSIVSRAALPPYTNIYLGAKLPYSVIQSDIDVAVVGLYKNPTTQVIGFDRSGNLVIDTGGIAPSVLPYPTTWCVIDRNELFMAYDAVNTSIYKVPVGVFDYAGPGPTAPVTSSPATLYPTHFGVSENYVFSIESGASSSSCTVKKLNRVDMTIVATYTQAVSSIRAKISVVDDRVFYTAGTVGATIKVEKWVDGVVVALDMPLSLADPWNSDPFERLISVDDGVHYLANDYVSSEKLIVSLHGSLSLNTVPLSGIVSAECLASGLLDASDIDVTALTQPVRGYKVSSLSSIRSALEPLQGCWPFDAIQAGYKIKFIPRGTSSVATIASSELDAREGGQAPGVQITQSREMDTQLPRRVEVTYLDAGREYDVGPAGICERLNTDAINVESIPLPIVLTAAEAAGKAQTLLYLRWLERHDISFNLPPTYLSLEVSDVVTIVAPDATYLCRLEEINYLPDGRLECRAKFASTAIYSPAAVGQVGLSTGQVLALAGNTQVALLDIPCLTDAMNTPGFAVALYGDRGSWPGGVLAQSWDGGQSWDSVVGAVPPQITVGVVDNQIGVGRADIQDESNIIVLQPMLNALSSVSQAQLLAGANHFAVGADGRWEIIGAQNCVQQGDGSWWLSGLLRGRFGTEWAMGTHQPYDRAVLLDSTELPFVTSDINRIGISRLCRAITNGKSIDSAPDVSFTYTGVNLECLAPVYLRGSRNAEGDWSIDGQRRTRIGGEWRDYVDATLGEAAEAYEIDIFSDATYTTVKRTISGLSSLVATYSAAQQTTDFGAVQSTLYIKAYQLSGVVGRGYPATANLTASVATAAPPDFSIPTSDPYWANVVLAMHMNGTHGGTTFTDQKGHTITRNNVTTVTDVSQFGGASAYFQNNTAYYLSTPAVSDFLLGAGDFTVDFFIRPNGTGAGKVVGIWSDTSGVGFSWKVEVSSTAMSLIYSTTGANSFVLTTSGLSIGTGAFKHIAVVRTGTTVYFFVGGVKVATHTGVSATFYAVASAKLLEIGRDGAGPASPLNAHLDELRVTKAVRWTADFYPPIAQFPDA